MKRRQKAALCMVTGLTLSMVMSGGVMAATAAENNKCGGKNIAVANVSSELLIRSSATADGTVVGYLPSAAGVIVESMNEEWTQVRSGNVTGFVKTDYLAFGDKAEELKSVYGVQGAVASWDDVKVFADYEDTSTIIGTLKEGEGFEVLGSTQDWVEIQLQNGDKAYVAAEDVDMTLVLDTAVSTEEYVAPVVQDSTDGAAYTEAAPSYYAEEPVYTDNTYYEDSAYYEDSVYAVQDDSYTEYTDTYETEAVYDASYTEESSAADTAAYTDDTAYISETEYVAETESTETDENDGITGDEYIDPETEVQEDTSTSAAASSSDLDLLAALIYCEAGNQSMEGMIAVGQVVMNRVASGSFANTIHDVIYESGQFTPASSGWLDQVIGSAPSECYDAALAAMNGEGSVPGCLYFNAGSGKGIQIGDHQFY